MVFDQIVLFTYIFSLTMLLIFASHGYVMLYYRNKNRDKKHNIKDEKDFPPVTIQLPLYNELYVVERLINSVCKITYPKDKLEIQVLDDSTDETVELVAEIIEKKRLEGFDITQIRRANRVGFKAGALKEGLITAKGEFIAIFDADFVPNIDFLEKTLPYFSNDNIGLIQTRWEHINEDYSVLTKIQALALDGHFLMEQTVRNKSDFFITFNGTGGIWRKSCILDAGNWEADTLTEDLDLSYRAQLKGWKFVFLPNVTTPAELPSEMNALKAQQFRWTKGAIETAKKMLPRVWAADLPFRIKLQCTFQLTSNIVFPFILIAGILNVPLIFIKNSGPYDGIFNFMAVFVLAFISSFLFYMNGQVDVSADWRKKISLFPLFMAGSMGMAVNNSRAVFEGLMNKKSEFIRTPKFKVVTKEDTMKKNKYLSNMKVDKSAFVELVLAIYCFIGVIASVYFLELAALPFHLMFFFGFAAVAYLSFKHTVLRNNG